MDKPKCKIIGEDGNVFNLIALTKKALIKADQKEKVPEFISKVMSCGSYGAALSLIREYVEIE